MSTLHSSSKRPFTVLFNILVMIAVKTKRQLRTKSNIALACLATSDFTVGLVLQPLHIATFILVVQVGETPNRLCTLIDVAKTVGVACTLASLYHLFMMSGERYLAIKHAFAYESGLVTEARIMVASGLSWLGAVITLPIDYISEASRKITLILTVSVNLFVLISVILYFHVVVYKEVRRNKKQIIANQVSLEARTPTCLEVRNRFTQQLSSYLQLCCVISRPIFGLLFVQS